MINNIQIITEDKKPQGIKYLTKFSENCNPEYLLKICKKSLYFFRDQIGYQIDLTLCKEGLNALKICFPKNQYISLKKN